MYITKSQDIDPYPSWNIIQKQNTHTAYRGIRWQDDSMSQSLLNFVNHNVFLGHPVAKGEKLRTNCFAATLNLLYKCL